MHIDPLTEQTIFGQALEISVEQREAFVQDQCGDNQLLLQSVLDLLAGHQRNEQSEFVLDRPVNPEASSNFTVAPIAESAGDTIGRYRLLEKIDEGGMGVVYMAEQIKGVKRRVALKIIKLGMDTREVIARFEVERQAMAMFDHPGITRVFDSGATTTGRPYFVMELVRGVGISRFVSENALSLVERLKLLISVCHAVQHAHQKGIIHRDLKPSNILVTSFDGVPVPKVIDFGIAKAIGQQLTEKTLFTSFSAMVGTPQYMSPEQVEMSGIDVDTRSDIYSLGVILYELITGSTPVRADSLKQMNPLALYETLRNSEIETPSMRITKSRESISKMASDVTLLESSESIKGGLDWIVMKALARDRTRRYATATELAADIERYLNNDPVIAAPPSRLYLFKTYLRKHRAAAVTVSLVSLAMLGAMITCSMFAINSHNANARLSVANESLSRLNRDLLQNAARLKEARENHRLSTNEKLCVSAFQIARVKFDMATYKMRERLYERMISEEKATSLVVTNADSDANMNDDVKNKSMIRRELIYTPHDVLDLKLKNELGAPFEQLVSARNHLKNVEQRLREEVDKFDRANRSKTVFDKQERTDWYYEIKRTLDEEVYKFRPEFFRHLVSEYRVVFGDDDPVVAGGLIVLAASLIEVDDLNEAEVHLREALALSEDDEKAAIVRRLGKIVEAQRAHAVPATLPSAAGN